MVASEGVVTGVNPLNLGAALPNFELETTTGPIKLAEWLVSDPEHPWTILFSHPADFTPVCTTEMGICHNMAAEFGAMGAKLIGVSCDPVDSHNEWAKDVVFKATGADGPLNFPIIADADKTLVTALGMLDPEEAKTEGTPMPARVLVILHQNVVKLTILYPATTGRNFDEVKRVLTSLKLTVENGFATPGNWKEGEAIVVAGGYAKIHPDKDITAVENYTEVALPSMAEGGPREGKPYLRTVPFEYLASLSG